MRKIVYSAIDKQGEYYPILNKETNKIIAECSVKEDALNIVAALNYYAFKKIGGYER
jgi:hypothetical protein